MNPLFTELITHLVRMHAQVAVSDVDSFYDPSIARNNQEKRVTLPLSLIEMYQDSWYSLMEEENNSPKKKKACRRFETLLKHWISNLVL